MITVCALADLRQALTAARRAGHRIGLVPTMGCLHDGHRSLIAVCRRETDVGVVSLFVNPLQFGPSEDVKRYPRTLEADTAICRSDGVEILFTPSPETFYAPDHSVTVEETALSRGLCGAARPGHFRGVTTVVAKLFNLVQPDVAVFGEKDAQQAAVIRRMVRDLNYPIRLLVAPTVREPDGLAMSSRNRLLDPAARRRAAVIFKALHAARAAYRQGERQADRLCRAIAERIEADPPLLQVDYVAAVDNETFEPVQELHDTVRLLVAVRSGNVRLIDNLCLA